MKKDLAKGIQFITDSQGQRIAVQIDLKKWSGLWEDFQDAMVSQSRKKEKHISLEKLKSDLKI